LETIKRSKSKNLYNFLVTANLGVWDKLFYEFPRERFGEFSEKAIMENFISLDTKAIEELKSFPTLFAYEGENENIRVGYIRRIKNRAKSIYIEYEFESEIQEIPFSKIADLKTRLDIQDTGRGIGEFNRTHWAIKDEDLFRILFESGLISQKFFDSKEKFKGVEDLKFKVSLSFPGEKRSYVNELVTKLKCLLPTDSVFYDKDFQSQLARPNLDTLLQRIYRDNSELVVIFISEEYEKKEWCGLEWRAIREIIMEKRDYSLMVMKFDNTHIEGISKGDGYIDLNEYSMDDVIKFIIERVQLNQQFISKLGNSKFNKEKSSDLKQNKESDPAKEFSKLGGDCYGKKDYDGAIENYSKAIELNPKDDAALVNRGCSYSLKGDDHQAFIDFNKAIELNPHNAYAYINRGDIYFDETEYDLAIIDYNNAIQANPELAVAYYKRGRFYSFFNCSIDDKIWDTFRKKDKNNYDRAMRDFNKTIMLDPQYSNAYSSRGHLYYWKGFWDQAIADYNKVLEFDLRNEDAYFKRGISYARKGKHDLAIKDFDALIELNPKKDSVYWRRGLSYFEIENYEKAISDYDKALELDPSFSFYSESRNDAYKQLKKKGLKFGKQEQGLSDRIKIFLRNWW
jgi:tetratricopeptide (TPR) repeat protein